MVQDRICASSSLIMFLSQRIWANIHSRGNRKKFGINKSTLWYQKKKLREGIKIKIYHNVITKVNVTNDSIELAVNPNIRKAHGIVKQKIIHAQNLLKELARYYAEVDLAKVESAFTAEADNCPHGIQSINNLLNYEGRIATFYWSMKQSSPSFRSLAPTNNYRRGCYRNGHRDTLPDIKSSVVNAVGKW